MLTVAVFQSVMRPSVLTPNMGLALPEMTRWYPASISIHLASVLRTSVTSWPTNITLPGLPEMSLDTVGPRKRSTSSPGATVPSYSNRPPLDVTVSWMGLTTYPSCAHCDTASSSFAAYTDRFSSLDTGCPIASSFLMPVRQDVILFQCVAMPVVSIPKMGAFAPSIRSTSSEASAEHCVRLLMRSCVSRMSILEENSESIVCVSSSKRCASLWESAISSGSHVIQRLLY
mmetsp:Transcript_9855/g.22995  ORF Transcript_9855/g.22995 Transcript_9855/m.22995 type:complete len:230 (-) Transcript_9855:1073-1762(-)